MFFQKEYDVQKNGNFEKCKSAGIAFAWFVWKVGYKGETILKWIE